MATKTLYSWNVNGIRAAFKKGFLDWVETTQPDVLCLQETKIQGHQLTLEMNTPPGDYKTYWSHAERPGYSGVSVWTKEEPTEVKYGFGIERFDSEGRSLILEYEDFVLFNHYYPNGGRDDERLKYKLDFYDAFLDYVMPLKEAGKTIIVTGDLNTAHKPIDIARPKENEKISGFLPIEREWMDKFVDYGFVDTFRHFHPEAKERYSWWSMRGGARARNVGWRLDYFFVNEGSLARVKSAEIHDQTLGSDHCPVSIEFE